MELELLPYLVKSGVLLTLLFMLYKLLLEKEKMHRFNRFFLLFSLLFGLIVPLISIDLNYDVSEFGLGQSIPQSVETFSKPMDFVVSGLETNTATTEAPFSILPYVVGFYFLVVSALVIRLIKNLYQVSIVAKSSSVIKLKSGQLVLMKKDVIPHTFLRNIFVTEEKYLKGLIAPEVLTHEVAHVKGLHSLDVLFVEILKITFWFNPIFYFYKKAIQLNHEFIADEVITKDSKTIPFYQSLLLDHTQQFQAIPLTSNFNYSLTKKRLIMMTKKTSRAQGLFRKLFFIPVLALSILSFSDVTFAQTIQKATVSELINELSAKVKTQDDLSDEEKENLRRLIAEINKKVEVYKLVQIPPPPPPQVKRVYTDQEIEDMIEQTSRNFREAISTYLNIEAKAENEVRLRASYDKAVIYYHELIKVAALRSGDEKAPPPPPLPPGPDKRLEKN